MSNDGAEPVDVYCRSIFKCFCMDFVNFNHILYVNDSVGISNELLLLAHTQEAMYSTLTPKKTTFSAQNFMCEKKCFIKKKLRT